MYMQENRKQHKIQRMAKKWRKVGLKIKQNPTCVWAICCDAMISSHYVIGNAILTAIFVVASLVPYPETS